MEMINISVNDIQDFKDFISDNLVECINFKDDGIFVTVIYNTNQKFIIPKDIYESVCGWPVITRLDQLFALDADMIATEEVAVDTETNGLMRFRKGLGLSFAYGETCFYIPLLKWENEQLVNFWPEDEDKIVRAKVCEWLKLSNKKWIGHNIVFDVITLENMFGINILNNVYSCTALLHHTCISEDGPHGLKPLSKKYISSDAEKAQEDLAASVIANGGKWNMHDKDFYKGDPYLLGKYGALDPYYTLKLHKMWYPEIKKQGLEELWYNEVLPLTKVIYELNTTGIKLDMPYLYQLKAEAEAKIEQLENQIKIDAKNEIEEYEFKLILEECDITPRSKLGKFLAKNNYNIEDHKKEIRAWYDEKGKGPIFSLNSKADLAFLLFDFLKLPILKTTKKGAAATDKKTLDLLIDLAEDGNPVLEALKARSNESKMLNTYVLPMLQEQVDGRIYPQFNQIGTSSGRFTSGEPINFQTLPRDDLRIKKCFIPDDNYVFVNADFASLEPRCFADRSNESEIKRVYSENLDLYSHVHILVMQDKEASAREEDDNFLKNINKDARQAAKTYTLGFAYQMSEYKYASSMGVSVEDALAVKDKYFATFPNLKKYQDECNDKVHKDFYISNLMGRKKRARLIKFIRKNSNKDPRNRWHMMSLYDKVQDSAEYQEIAERLKKKNKPIRNAKDFAYAVKSEYNNSTNFPIQSLAASIANASCIEAQEMIQAEGLRAKLVLQVHDEITLVAHKDDAKRAAEILKLAMEKNKVAQKISVPMKADPIIANNLAEAK